ncbi:MAG TPA: M28 family peptidase, partial [Planctomycetota bacterium]|nr:M28 family peptidase [Planctomycetota bacterium]
MKYLASDALEGRATGSPGGEKAAAYVEAQLKAAGLEPKRQEFDFLAGIALGPKTGLRLDLRGEARDGVAQDDFTPLGFSSNGAASGEVVFCGYGITAPEAGYDDYATVDVKGKVALVLDQVPHEELPRKRERVEDAQGSRGGEADAGAGPHESRLAADAVVRFGQVRYKAMNAREHGAVAMLVVSHERSGSKEQDPSLLPLSGNVMQGDAGLVVADVRRSLAAELVARAGRSLDQVQGLIDASLAPHSLVLAGIAARLEVDLVRERRKASNVIAIRPGTDPDPAIAAQAIVIGAHFDHLGRGEVGGSLADKSEAHEIHNGADDNASGTADMLELARTLPKTRRTIVFAGFSGEEMGLLGSAAYVKDPPYPLEKTVAMINMDMVGRLGKKKLTIGGMGTAAEWRELVPAAAERARIEFTGQEDGYGPSDHSSFYGKGIPVLFLFTGAHADYHKPSDDWDKIDYPGAARIAELARELVLAIDALPKPPAVQKSAGNPHGGDLEPGRGPQVYFGSIPDYSETDQPGVRLTGVRDGSPADKA